MAFEEFIGKQTFSGADIMIMISIPFTTPVFKGLDKPYKISAEIQTLTISSVTSILPVRRVGEARPKSYTRGARTFAGSMVFTVMDSDPFKEIFSIDALNNSMAVDDAWHIDQLPPFDITIIMNNEHGGIAAQMIHNIRLVHWGTTYSVDDMYSEYTYSYVAQHVTPLLASIGDLQDLEPKLHTAGALTPDDIAFGLKENPGAHLWTFDSNIDLTPKSVWFKPIQTISADPGISNEVYRSNGNL